MLRGGLVIRPVKSVQEIDAVVDLTAKGFEAEVRGSGLTSPQWQGLEKEHLVNNPSLWRHVGVAVENGNVLGAAILKFHGGRERHIPFWQLVWRIGFLAAIWSLVSNELLVDSLGPHDALADMIVVASSARGRGIGVALMRWCEAAATAEWPAQSHVNLFLWVAADTPAVHLYEKAGFTVTKRTSDDPSAWFMRHILRSFLGHATWLRMVKRLTQPRPLGPSRPLLKQLSMKTIEGIPEGRAVGVMWPPAAPITSIEAIDKPQKMVFWRTMSGRVDLKTGEDWRIGASINEVDDGVELSDDELIRRFEENVSGRNGMERLDHEGMQLASAGGFDCSPHVADKGTLPVFSAIPCVDPLTQDGQNRLWRLAHQKSFDKESVGAELPVGDGAWIATTRHGQTTVKEHLQGELSRRPARSTSGGSPRNVIVDFRR